MMLVRRFVILLLLAVLIAGCGGEEPAPTEAPAETPTVAPATVSTVAPTVAPTQAPAVAPTEAVAVEPGAAGSGITTMQISLDTQGLPYSWHSVIVPATPYDTSQPPGPKGLPEHIEILFGVTDPADRQPTDPIMYIIPVNEYRELWDAAGNPAVTDMMAAIEQTAFILPSPAPTSGMPALPYEELVGVNDLAAQLGFAVPRSGVNMTSATQTGYRFVGRWAQGPNPVTNQGLDYVYQGFTNDGLYLVSFFYPVTTPSLPMDAGAVSSEEMAQVDSDPAAYTDAKAQELNALATSDWQPDLATLDALVASLAIQGMPIAGIHDETWLWTGFQSADGQTTPVNDPSLYQVVYRSDGTINVIADCNLSFMSYTLNVSGMVGGMLVQPGPMTLAECGPESRYSEFINNILASQNYQVRAGGDPADLVLPAGGGQMIMSNLENYSQTVNPPAPEAGEPTATVIAPAGVNVRTGPGDQYAVLGVAPFGRSGRLVGVSEDGQWWVVYIPAAPGGQGWVSASFVAVENADNVPVIPAPPLDAAAPTPSPAPTSPPPPSMSFTASRTTINAGESATLSWDVQNVSAVYMYPVGDSFANYPVTGQGSRDVWPGITTSYELLVFNTDGTTSAQRIEITVVGGLTSNQWTVLSMSSAATGLVTTLPGTVLTARFEASGALSGSAGCNTYTGGFTAYDQTLRVSSPLASGMVFCGDPAGIMEQEQLFLSLLQSAVSFQISAGQLSVFDGSGNRVLVFTIG